MVKILLFLLVGLFNFNCYSQDIIAYTDTIEAVVIHKYSKIDNTCSYCIAPAILLTGQDTLLFYGDTSYNMYLIKENPFFISILGQISDYDYDFFSDALDNNYKQNLNFSPYNALDNPFLNSISLYFMKLEDNCIYSIYNFYGVVNIYKGVKNKEINDDEYDLHKSCPCNFRNTSDLNLETEYFAVLKETLELKSLTEEQILDLKITKSDKEVLRVLICE